MMSVALISLVVTPAPPLPPGHPCPRAGLPDLTLLCLYRQVSRLGADPTV